MTTELQRKL